MALNKNNYKEMLKETWGDRFEFQEEYINSKTPIDVKCNTCQHVWKKAPYELICRKTGCPNCASKLPGHGYKKSFTEKDFENKLISLFSENPYEFITPFKGYKEKITVKHKVCGYQFESKPSNLTLSSLKHPVCKNCLFSNKKMNTEKYQKKLDNFFGEDKSYDVLEEYVNENKAIKHRCRICNYEWNTSPANISGGLYGKTRVCPSCNNMIRDDYNNLSYEERVKKINPNIIPLEKYINGRIKIKHKCNICNNVWNTAPKNILDGNGCPKCANKITQSKYELDLIDVIKKANKDTKSDLTIIEKDRKILDGRELDIYIPEKKIAIEVNDLYWHCDEHKDKNYHINKTKECEKKGIRLIHIFDDDNFKIASSKVLHIIGLHKNLPKVYARKCYIEEIDSKIKNQFLNENHLQGADSASIKLGLWYPQEDGDVLVSVMTFRKPQLSLGNKKGKTSYDYELSRFANCNEFIVEGSFGKLFSYFKKNYKWTNLITYADLRWSVGGIYEKNGFKLDHISAPNYYYFNKHTKERYHRFSFRKQVLKDKFPDLYDPNKTEFQIMNETKIYKRIYDCGNIIYTYTK